MIALLLFLLVCYLLLGRMAYIKATPRSPELLDGWERV